MRKKFILLAVLIAALVILLPPPSCHAQSWERGNEGYIFFAPGVATSQGARNSTLHAGGGGEFFIHKGFAFAGEGGYLAPFQNPGDGLGVLSTDGAYHFNRKAKTVPFVNAGYSLFFRGGVANAVNFGGGATYWFKDRLGLRFEVRDHYVPSLSEHYLGFRVGLAF